MSVVAYTIRLNSWIGSILLILAGVGAYYIAERISRSRKDAKRRLRERPPPTKAEKIKFEMKHWESEISEREEHMRHFPDDDIRGKKAIRYYGQKLARLQRKLDRVERRNPSRANDRGG